MGVALGRLDAALLTILAVEGAVSRQRLMQLLGSDDDLAEDPRNVLRQRLFRLRRTVGAAVIVRADLVSLADGTAHDVGLDGDGLLLGGHDYAGFPAFERWLDAQRRALASSRRGRLSARIDECEKEGRLGEAAALAERMADADPRDEAAAQRLMKLLYLDGRRAAAIAAFERLAAALRDDAGEEPSAATIELLTTIRAARDPLPLARRVMPASVLRPPRLVGRDVERLRLEAAWVAERAFWLHGEAGMGKTRLIGEFVAQACAAAPEALEALVVAARPGDAGVPYASLGRGLRALVERRPQLLEDGERDDLARVMPQIDRKAAVSPAPGSRRVYTAIESLLADAHRAGARRHRHRRLALRRRRQRRGAAGVRAQRTAVQPALGIRAAGGRRRSEVEAFRAALEELQRVDVVELAPLDEAGLGELVASLGLPGLDPVRLAPLLAQHTGGNPMYTLETIKQLVLDSGAVGDGRCRAPANVGQLIERRLASSRRGARAGPVAPWPASTSRSSCGAAPSTCGRSPCRRLARARGGAGARGDAFAHDLVHETVLAGLPAPIAAHTHGAVAAFLESNDGEPARVAAHWQDAGKPKRALVALHAAARAANRAMRRKEEAQFLERAARIETEDGDPAAFDTWHQRVEALWAADFHAFDTDLFDHFEQAAATPRQRAIARSLRANWVQQCGDHEEAKRLARSAVDLADASGDEATVAFARIRLAEALDFDGDAAAALALLEPLQGWAAERASEQEQAEFCCRLALALDNAGRGGDARIHHRRAIALSRRLGQWSDLVTLLGNLSISWDKSGYLERSIEAAREALELVAAHDEARGCGVTLAGDMFQLLRDSGRYEEAFRWAEPALAAEQGARAALTRCNIGLAWIISGSTPGRSARSTPRSRPRRPPGCAPGCCRSRHGCCSRSTSAGRAGCSTNRCRSSRRKAGAGRPARRSLSIMR